MTNTATATGCTTDGCLCWMLGECDTPAAAEQPVTITPRPHPTTPTIGTRRTDAGTDTGYAYTGLIRINATVTDCGHLHRNRDARTSRHGQSARGCAERILAAANRPDYAAELVAEVRDGWMHQQSGPWQVTAGQIERFKVASARDADLLAEKIAAVRAAVSGGTR